MNWNVILPGLVAVGVIGVMVPVIVALTGNGCAAGLMAGVMALAAYANVQRWTEQ